MKSLLCSMRAKVFLSYFLVLSVSFLVLSLAVTIAARQILTDQIGSSRLDFLRQISERANSVTTNAITISGIYRYEMTSMEESMAQGADVDAQLRHIRNRYGQVFDPIGMENELIVVTEAGVFSSMEEEKEPLRIEEQLWYRRLHADLMLEDAGTVMFSSTFPARDGTHYQFAAAQRVQGEKSSYVLLVILSEEVLQKLYEPALTDGNSLYIYDSEGFIVSHNDRKMLGKQFVDPESMAELYGINCATMIQKLGMDYLLTTYVDETTGWTIVEEIPASALFGVLNRMYGMVWTILVGCLLVSLAVSLYRSHQLAAPLTQLSQAMDTFDGMDYAPLAVDSGVTEIDSLSNSFNHMAGEISSLMDAVTEKERQKRVAEMNFLRAQINPHFLYNMLFSIRCTVEIGKEQQAVRMIEAFTDLLKTTLRSTGDEITLSEEFENTRKYLVVQKMRYGEKTNFEMDMAEDTARCMVPSLILQPIVENAIFHGLEAKEDARTVVVASTVEGEDLVLTVTDDGAGMDPEALKKLMDRIHASGHGEKRQTDSIGLANVHERIRLNYGESYGIGIQSALGIGTTVTLRLPLQRSVNR